MSIDFACPSCQKKYRVKDELAGKAAKCSKCNERFKVPTPAAALEPLDELTDGNSLGDWFDDELSASKSMTAATASPSASPAKSPTPKSSGSNECSACGSRLTPGAVICVACGFDLRSGKQHETKKVLEDDETPSKRKAAASQTASLARGALFSAIGAALGAAVWAAVAIGLDVQLGWIAWGLGFAAGAGMAIGHEDKDGTVAGIVAGGISILGIVGAKFYLYKHLKSSAADMLGIGAIGGQDGEALKAAMTEALDKVFAEQISFGDMFGPIDGIFILLAVATAYQIGSGQMTD